MPTYKVDLTQTVHERATLYVQAHSNDQAEQIAQYIAENGKDPWDRHFIDVEFTTDEVTDGPEVLHSTELLDVQPCNHMPEHTHGLWKDDDEDNAA